MTTGGRTPPNKTADVIVALRIHLHRLLDKHYDQLCEPNARGTLHLEVSAADGRPNPSSVRHYVENVGVGQL